MFARKSGRKIPAYRVHKTSGWAYVRLTVDGGRETVYLGPYDSRESLEEYDRVVGDWLATKMTPQRKEPGTTVRDIGERLQERAGATTKPRQILRRQQFGLCRQFRTALAGKFNCHFLSILEDAD
jgi:hypothetical protein